MEVKICKTCGKEFLCNTKETYCRICNKKWHQEQEMLRKEADDKKWQEEKKKQEALFEQKILNYHPIEIADICPSVKTLYIIGNGFDLMHRVPSSYYSFRDSLGKRNGLRESLELALTEEDIWADFENALGTLNLDLMGSRHIVNMWLDNFGYYDDEDAGAAEFYMAVEAAANPIINLVEELHPAFRRWINRLEIGTDDKPLSGLICADGKVLDFNYTEFIETLYGVHNYNICYIHGNRTRNEQLILGHKSDVTLPFYEKERKPKNHRQAVIDVAQENVFDIIGQYDDMLTKNSREIIGRHQDFFSGLKEIDQIVVLGHSLSGVDWDYFAEVKRNVKSAHWYLGIFCLNDLRNMEKLIQTMDIKEYSVFRTDVIWTKANKIATENLRITNKIKPQVYKNNDNMVTISDTYKLMVDDEFELILSNSVRKVVFVGEFILVKIDDLGGSILLLGRQEKTWRFVNRLESFEHQSLINRRLNHIYYEGNVITFVYNNRIRKYDLKSGELIVNKQLRNAKSKEYSGVDIINQFFEK